MTPPLRALVKVEDLFGHPERVATLDPAEAQRLTIQLAALLVLMSTRASEPAPISVLPDPVLWLSVEQVTQQFGLSPAWLHEHRRLLSSLGVTSRPSRKTTLFDRRKLLKFVESRRSTNLSGDLKQQALS